MLSLFQETSANVKGSRSNTQVLELSSQSDLKQFIGGSETVPLSSREEHAPHARLAAAKMLGNLNDILII